MSVIHRTIQIPLFIKIEAGALNHLRAVLSAHQLHFQKPLILSEQHILKHGGNSIVSAFDRPATVLLTDNTIAEGQRLAKEMREKQNDVMINIGGGRVLDVGKYAATKANINYISVPTAPSNDGICSPIAVLKESDGTTQSLPVNMPLGILVDTQMLTTAPLSAIRSGIGDLISNFSAIGDWRLSVHDGKDQMDDFAASIAYSAAQLMLESCRIGDIELTNEQFLEKLVHGLILSGIAMNIAGSSRPASGSEHKISHAIDVLFPGRSEHGLQVAMATVLTSFMRNEPLKELLDFYRRVGLPITWQELNFTIEDMMAVMKRAPDMRTERYTILEKMQLNESAMRTLLNSYIAKIHERTT